MDGWCSADAPDRANTIGPSPFRLERHLDEFDRSGQSFRPRTASLIEHNRLRSRGVQGNLPQMSAILAPSPRASNVSPAAFSNMRKLLKRPDGARQRRISAILRGFSHGDRPSPTIGEMSLAFDTRAFGAFFILFGGLNVVPLPPGASLVFGLPLILFTLQLAVGRHRLWLPKRVRRISISPERLSKVMAKIGPGLRRVERLARRRYWPEPEWVVLSATGWFCFIMAVIVAIPFPLTNMFPGIAIALAGVAISARDGLWLAAAVILGVAATAFLAGVYGMAVLALLQIV